MEKSMNIYEFRVGDVSGDGHEKEEKFFIETNLTATEIVAAYKEFTAKHKIGFEYHKKGDDFHSLFADYEDSIINDERKKLLANAGIDYTNVFCLADEDDEDDGDLTALPEDMPALFFAMIQTIRPDLEWRIFEVDPKKELVNELRKIEYNIGYGVFPG